jgi:hypothetical protein
MGLTLTVTCAAEIPAFHLQGAVLRRVRVEALLHFVIATYALRLALYAALPAAGSAWAVLPIELLHGVTFGWAGACARTAQALDWRPQAAVGSPWRGAACVDEPASQAGCASGAQTVRFLPQAAPCIRESQCLIPAT